MTDKFTDEEIIRNYEWCIGCTSDRCRECTMDEQGFCEEELQDLVLDLINRQKAEIERLKKYPRCVHGYDGEVVEYCAQSPCPNFKTVEQIKSEACKEFAERLKEKDFNFCIDAVYDGSGAVKIIEINQSRFNKQIGNLLKEMVGEE